MTTPHAIVAASFFMLVVVTSLPAQQSPGATLAHTRTEFHFTANAPLEKTAPLFGADAERNWAPGWNPKFVYPQPAHDQQGMIFQVAHGEMTSTWVNTVFDLGAGHIQYAYVLGDAMVTTIEIHLTRQATDKTGVNVVYERTALLPEANQHVRHFENGDAKAGEEWERQINEYLAKMQAKP